MFSFFGTTANSKMLRQEGYDYLIGHVLNKIELVHTTCIAKHRVLGARPIEATDVTVSSNDVVNKPLNL